MILRSRGGLLDSNFPSGDHWIVYYTQSRLCFRSPLAEKERKPCSTEVSAYLLNKACETVRCHDCDDLWVSMLGRLTVPAAAEWAPLGGGHLIAGGQTWPRLPFPPSLSRSYTANLFTLNVEKCPVALAEERSCENDKLIFVGCKHLFLLMAAKAWSLFNYISRKEVVLQKLCHWCVFDCLSLFSRKDFKTIASVFAVKTLFAIDKPFSAILPAWYASPRPQSNLP